tara:strand:+ start:1808 stop:3598 length:1791 start_codon:yes stop_codon:yes gene_type:complete
MRVSSFPLATLRDSPSEAEIVSHQLLLKGGYIRRVSAGIYAYMPLLQRVIDKIISLIDHEFFRIGCNKLLLPQLHPAELWKRSERWEGYTAGEGIMFNLKDRQQREFGLAPTHEEVITKIASEIINSYKQLPICYYQIQTKFRDEIRPRFGLMRSREFIMKDAYSFHSSEEDLVDFYNIMEKSYKEIFKNCGLNVVGVDADSGAIGGAASKEFMITADSGEDSILYTKSGSYAANLEKAVSIPVKGKPLEVMEQILIHTPNQTSINDICKKNNFDPSQLVKVIIYLGILEDNSELPILVCIRGDQFINEVKLYNLVTQVSKSNLISLTLIDKESDALKNLNKANFGFLGPDLEDNQINLQSTWGKEWLRVVDFSAFELSMFISGANKKDYHKFFNSWGSLSQQFIKADVRNAMEGDYLSLDKNETLIEKRGIEIGHIFQLGQKYSEKLNAKFSNKQGNLENIWMGCYGIGVTRLAQAAIEQNHDDKGICWPIQIAPFEVVLIPTNIKDPNQKNFSELIYKEFLSNNIDILFDDRDERAGVKFKDADLIGIPFRIIVGRDSINGEVELISRSKTTKVKVSSKELLEKFLYESKLMYN